MRNLHTKFPFFSEILFPAVFKFTGRKRITFYVSQFKNFNQNNKNEESFAFDYVIKIAKSYIIKNQLKSGSHYKEKDSFHPLKLFTKILYLKDGNLYYALFGKNEYKFYLQKEFLSLFVQ